MVRVFLSLTLALAALHVHAQSAWSGTTVSDLHSEYYNIFPSSNRNAASHRWAHFVLQRADQMTASKVSYFFTGFCPVSGSPVTPGDRKRYTVDVPTVGGKQKRGLVYLCCWPCSCDTTDHIFTDTKTIATKDGEATFDMLVIGNPCVDPDKIPGSAPDASCKDGQLEAAVLSDHGHPIIGMLHPPDDSLASEQPETYLPHCLARAKDGYRSGMGKIFIDVASISPIEVTNSTSLEAPADSGGELELLSRNRRSSGGPDTADGASETSSSKTASEQSGLSATDVVLIGAGILVAGGVVLAFVMVGRKPESGTPCVNAQPALAVE